jgi:hypothetical protein
MYNICTIYVQHMYNICTTYVQYMYDICTIYIQYMYDIYTMYVQHMYNNRIINCNNKMKTTRNIIKAGTNRLQGPTNTNINNYQNYPKAFNKYLLLITENIINDIECNNKG